LLELAAEVLPLAAVVVASELESDPTLAELALYSLLDQAGLLPLAPPLETVLHPPAEALVVDEPYSADALTGRD
jgi:hypothetical protein